MGGELSNRDRPRLGEARNTLKETHSHENLNNMDDVLHQSYGIAGTIRPHGDTSDPGSSTLDLGMTGKFTFVQEALSNQPYQCIMEAPCFP